MDYEYVALESEWGLSEEAAELLCFQCNELITQEWKEWIRIPWYGSRAGHVRIFRRESRRPKDELRMWTEGELDDRIRAVNHCLAQPPSGCLGRIWLTREEKTIYCQELQKRNEELQTAINVVVSTAQNPDFRDKGHVSIAVKEFLYPLATKVTVVCGSNWTIKEESNEL